MNYKNLLILKMAVRVKLTSRYQAWTQPHSEGMKYASAQRSARSIHSQNYDHSVVQVNVVVHGATISLLRLHGPGSQNPASSALSGRMEPPAESMAYLVHNIAWADTPYARARNPGPGPCRFSAALLRLGTRGRLIDHFNRIPRCVVVDVHGQVDENSRSTKISASERPDPL